MAKKPIFDNNIPASGHLEFRSLPRKLRKIANQAAIRGVCPYIITCMLPGRHFMGAGNVGGHTGLDVVNREI
jgi:hypothetical protein